MGKKTKLWIKMLAATTILSAGLVWSGITAYAAEGDVEINEENFPDSGFRRYIFSNVDLDDNGFLSQDEISRTKEMDISYQEEIFSLEGIRLFENLEYLNCENLSEIKSLDLSHNHNLVYLECNCCLSLTNLDLSNNYNLEKLYCMDCYRVKELDLSNNIKLKDINCLGCSGLTFLDLTELEKLEAINIFQCFNLTELKLGKKPYLRQLISDENKMTVLDLSGCAIFDSLENMEYYVEDNDIHYSNDKIDLSFKKDLHIVTAGMLDGIESDVTINESNFPDEKFRTYVKNFDVLDSDGCLSIYELSFVNKIDITDIESVSGIEFFRNLQSFHCKSDELKEIDLSKNVKLKELRLECKKLKKCDLSKNMELEEVNCLGTKLDGLDLTNNKKLKRVSFWTYSGIVDLSNHPTLESVHQEGLTTYLNLEGDTCLTKIEFQDSDLAKINIKGCTALQNLNFTGSALTELDLTGCEKIESLQLSMPKLQKLYAGPDSQLKEFIISNSEQLSSIDLSGSANLESFSCTGCPLVEKLAISNEAPLREFICNNTILKELDLSPYSKLGTLNIYTNNALEKLSLPQQSQLGTVDIQGNGKLAVIQFPQSGKIENLVCKNNAVENADLSGCNEVKKVDFNGNASLKSINLPVQIKSLVLGNNKSVSNIQFPQGCKVSTISCNDSGMENIDLSECHELEKAEFTNNAALKSIVFPNSDYLETIKCNQNNLLQSIDVSKCKYLLELYCGGNALQSLNLLDNINLRKLDCNNNQLKDLVMPRDLSYDILTSGGDTEKVKNNLVVNSLKDLNCSSNQLKNLELSDCEALTDLDCTKNQIKRIDISSCDELLKRVTGAKEEASGQVKYVDGIDGGYCLTCDSNVKVIFHGTVDELFDDVIKSEWYMQAIQFVYNNKVMRGVSDTSFAPKMTLTREQFITVLYNLEGSPEITFKNYFDDVTDANSWFAKSVTWAAENGITSGVGGNKFGVGVEITREQLATLLYNYAQKKDEYKLSVDENAVANFPDADKIDSWASAGMKWAITNGVMSGKKGKDDQLFLDPLGKATRAECAQMIKNLKENAVK